MKARKLKNACTCGLAINELDSIKLLKYFVSLVAVLSLFTATTLSGKKRYVTRLITYARETIKIWESTILNMKLSLAVNGDAKSQLALHFLATRLS